MCTIEDRSIAVFETTIGWWNPTIAVVSSRNVLYRIVSYSIVSSQNLFREVAVESTSF